jgi:hypothetical protein
MINEACLRAVILDYDLKIQYSDMIVASALVTMWLVALVYIEYKKVYRSVLWRIVIYLLISSISCLVYAINDKTVVAHCDVIPPSMRPPYVIITSSASFGTGVLFFSLSYWLLFYKYWEVAITQPDKEKGN